MGLYDAVDRGGAGRKKEKTLRKPLLIAAAIIAAVVALAVWACRYQLQFRSCVSALTDATRHARSTGDFTVTVDGAAVPAGADDLSDLLRLITASGAGRTGTAPADPPLITITYGDGTVLDIWQVPLENPSNDWTEGPFFRCTFPGGKTYGYDTDQIPMTRLTRLFSWRFLRRKSSPVRWTGLLFIRKCLGKCVTSAPAWQRASCRTRSNPPHRRRRTPHR